MDPTNPIEVSEEEKTKREESRVVTIVRTLLADQRDKDEAATAEALATLKTPERTTVALHKNTDDRVSHISALRTNPVTEPMYRQLSADVREIRNPDTDHWMAEWIRGNVDKNHARMLTADAKLRELLPEMYRADTAEGVAGADGALSDGTGGALIPRPLEAVVMIERDPVAKMRRFAAVYNMTRQQHTIPTAGAVTSAMTAEGADITEGNPEFASISLVAHKCATICVATAEMLADSAFNLMQIYATRAGASIAAVEDGQFWALGDGNAPNVSASYIGSPYLLDLAPTLTYEDLVTMYFTVPQQYREGAAWFANSDVLSLISGMLATDGRPLMVASVDTPAVVTDDPMSEGSLLRKPVYEVPTAAEWLSFANLRQGYAVGSRAGITSAASSDVGFVADTVYFKFTSRFDGNNVDAEAGVTTSGITAVG
jgi:HK97 family phage major capsid protein